jgi:hypothetical protein
VSADDIEFSPATAFAAEGASVGLVTCLSCGTAILLSMAADSLALHREWHKIHVPARWDL